MTVCARVCECGSEWFEYFAALVRTAEGTVPPFSGAYVNYVQRVPLGVVGQVRSATDSLANPTTNNTHCPMMC